ncbi:glycosyltransferase family 2 protein [Halogeometricum limi]|uniref:Glycosyltransferase involved in cell wall bisynthesis n=1 Tax=Halogeometricum limi TaxID=555875 RepID=A0A1I6G3R9_9EURY|nr:glycosyltransferase family 2 protein [Halogeometricum limi]SFR36858.1 Glycosyltransferase involved in cell wall bisynthesis [Halogeometricum limi]
MTSVSVLIPTYNRAAYVGGAIDTVLEQTYSDIEAVVVNDGSDDDTRAVLDARAGDRVRVFHNDENRGISYSFNRAAAEARGEYLCILGDDDRWHPVKVERQVRRMESLGDEYGVVYTGGFCVRDDVVTDVSRPSWRGDIYPEILGTFGVGPHSGHMIRREAFEAVDGFDTAFPRGVDWDMSIRLAKRYKFDYLPELFVRRTLHDDNISREPEQMDLYSLVLDKYADELYRHPDALCRLYSQWYYQKRATHALHRGETRRAARYFLSAFRLRPTATLALSCLVSMLGPRGFDAAGTVRRRMTDWRIRATGEYPWTGVSSGP